MKLHLIALCILLSATGSPIRLTAAEPVSKELPLVILIGDSIRVGYQDTVAKALSGKAVVWSPRENCKSSVYVRENLDKWLGGRDPAVVHINAGLHDLVRRSPDATVTDIVEYEENVRAIVAALQRRKGVTIIWATTTPVDDELNAAARAAGSSDGKRVAWRENETVIRFNAAAAKALSDSGVVVNDLYGLVSGMNDQDLYLADGVHFSLYGREFLGDAVAKAIAAQLPLLSRAP
jgi:lysophospholipase L1-like esterase